MRLWKSRFSEKNIFESVLLSVQRKDHDEKFNLATKSPIFRKIQSIWAMKAVPLLDVLLRPETPFRPQHNYFTSPWGSIEAVYFPEYDIASWNYCNCDHVIIFRHFIIILMTFIMVNGRQRAVMMCLAIFGSLPDRSNHW